MRAKMLGDRAARLGLQFVVGCIVMASVEAISLSGAGQHAESTWLDALNSTVVRQYTCEPVVILGLDRASSLGRGDCGAQRACIAEAVRRVAEGRPAVIIVDVVLSRDEEDEGSGTHRLVHALRESGHCVLATSLTRATTGEAIGVEWPDELLKVEAKGLGFSDLPFDDDHVIRRARLLEYVNGVPHRSLADEGVRLARTREVETHGRSALGRVVLLLVQRWIPVADEARCVLINWAARASVVQRFSLGDLIGGRVSGTVFGGAVVLIGETSSSKGLLRTRGRWFGQLHNVPHLEIEAQIATMLLTSSLLRRVRFLEPLVSLLLYAMAYLLFSRFGIWRAFGGLALISIGLSALSAACYLYLSVYWNVVAGWIAVFLAAAVLTIVRGWGGRRSAGVLGKDEGRRT